MHIEKYITLPAEKVNEIKRLEKACMPKENYRTMIFETTLNFSKELPAFYLAYHDEKLVGVVNLFAPQNHEVELMAYVHPEYRMQNVFKQLINEVLAELEKYPSVKNVLLTYDEVSNEAKQVLMHWGLNPTFTEYEMILQDPAQILQDESCGLTVKPITRKDEEVSLALSVQAFGGDIDSAKNYLQTSMQVTEKTIYGAFVEDFMHVPKQVGMCVLTKEEGTTYLSGVVVDERERGNGYGKQMLQQVLYGLQGSCTLEVNSENAVAFPLYKKLGFVVTTQTNYVAIPIEQLKIKVK